MRCSSRVTVYRLKRLLLGKLSVPPLYDVRTNSYIKILCISIVPKCIHLNEYTIPYLISTLFPGVIITPDVSWAI